METEKNNNRRRNMKGWSLGGVRHKNGCWICLSDRGGGEAKIYSQGGRENRREGGREGGLGAIKNIVPRIFLLFSCLFLSFFSLFLLFPIFSSSLCLNWPFRSFLPSSSLPCFTSQPFCAVPIFFFSSFPAIPLPPLVSFSSCRSLSPPLPFLSAVVSVRERVSGSRAIQVGNKSLTPRRKRGVWAGMAGRR